MLEYVVRQTAAYMESMPKQIRKKSGQFFTSIETARFMAGLFAIPAQPEITILDPELARVSLRLLYWNVFRQSQLWNEYTLYVMKQMKKSFLF